jgi:hypothetical protein
LNFDAVKFESECSVALPRQPCSAPHFGSD